MKRYIKHSLIVILTLLGCLNSNAQQLKPKVVVICVDGLTSAMVDPSLNFVATPNIDNLITEGFSDLGTSIDNSTPQSYPQAGWTSILTGMDFSRSGVSDDLSAYNSDDGLSAFAQLSNAGKVTAAFVRSQALVDILGTNAQVKLVGATDDEVVNAAVDNFNNNADTDFTFIQLKEAFEQGTSGGFSGFNTNYILAVGKIDQQVGKIVDAINSRSSFDQENWKVIFTSSSGGKQDGTIGGTDPTELFVPLVMSGKFVQRLEPKAELGKNNAVETLPYVLSNPASGYGSHIFAIGPNPSTDNNVVFGDEVTIELWAKQTIDRGNAWQTLFDCENDKCLLAIHQQAIKLYTNGTTISFPRTNTEMPLSFAILPNTLYHYAVSIKPATDPGKKLIVIYINGNIYGELETEMDFGTNRGYYSFNVGNGLRRAQRSNVFASWVYTELDLYNYVDGECFYGVFDEVRVWNKALPQSTIQEYMRLEHIENSHPDRNDLFLYWTFDEVEGTSTKDWSGNGYDGHYNWWTDADPHRIKVKQIPFSAFTLGSVYSTIIGHLLGSDALGENAPEELNSTWYFLSQD